ncbi:DUF4365 domain-containing protein [Hyalangium rubrum]|uniref:DUF4365 domain-containing protein n=1 Tax=Hyalangium rubrum TaxID=3103134 RepID=A0ABU5H7E4_9BACT|nr:DUF4365 domain-containing protein [Hyalangium sp. s54d21]MDY7229403.1 DUF4365 domain-containing protein [Hyalangium sp. s54d21]
MTREQQKEEISKAYVHAVAARCGFAVGQWSQDQGCVDVSIGASGALGGGTLEDPRIDLQLKCTSDAGHVREDHIAWQLSRSHYDKLRARSSVPKLLVVLVLPEREAEWMRHSVEALIIKRCAYWLSMSGMPAVSSESRVVQLPRTNLFSPEQLNAMMERVSRGEPL